MDLNKSIRMAVDTGKVAFGSEMARKLALSGGIKTLVLAANCPAGVKQDLQHYCRLSQVNIIEFNGSGVELGTVCGKPFTVSALSIVAEGNSDILSAVRS